MSCHSLVEKENTVWISVLGCLLCPLLVCMDSWWMNGLIAVNGRKRSRQRNNKCAEPLSAGVQTGVVYSHKQLGRIFKFNGIKYS